MIVKKGFIAEGTVCDSCTKIVKRQAKKVDGVKIVDFDYAKGEGYVEFDNSKTDIDKILYKIEEKGYKCFVMDENSKSDNTDKIFGWIFGLIGVFIVGYYLFQFVESFEIPAITQSMGYGLLFVVGLLTGFHCISMCGGFVVSYTAKDAKEGRKSHKSHILYSIGRLTSYTLIGAIFGLIGSIIAFTPTMRGVVGILAGLFLVVFGLNMLNLLPGLRKFRLKMPKKIQKMIGKKQNSSPLVIGLLNGLMIACGPLQAIYIMAAGTGSFVEGAKLLFIFALGTIPALMGFGYLASYVSGQVTHKILKASGVIVIVLGLFMLNNGLVLTGAGYDFKSVFMSVEAMPETTLVSLSEGFQEIHMDVTRYGFVPDKFVLKKDVPVKWIINGKELTGCNNAIQVPSYDLEFDVKQGEQVIEFTPTKEGVISWSCWMGMIPGTFIVKEDVGTKEEIQKELATIPKVTGGSCGGGCGCGA